jgi:hypothetical protein
MTQAVDEHLLELLRVFKNTPADLDADRRAYPRVHFDSPFTLTYFVTVPGAPFARDVVAYFRDQPEPATAAYEISLRRGAARPDPGP